MLDDDVEVNHDDVDEIEDDLDRGAKENADGASEITLSGEDVSDRSGTFRCDANSISAHEERD